MEKERWTERGVQVARFHFWIIVQLRGKKCNCREVKLHGKELIERRGGRGRERKARDAGDEKLGFRKVESACAALRYIGFGE